MNVIMVTSTADSGAGSLRQAIADAQDGDVILFDADVFPAGQTTAILLSSYITINKSVSIYGGESDGQGGYTSGATKRYYVYRDIEGVKTKVYIDDETPAQDNETILFENVCRVALDGQGAVAITRFSSNKTLTCCGVEYKNGYAANGGGAYHYGYSETTFIDCNFVSCEGTTSAGAIRTDADAIFTINNCAFTNCESKDGGAIFSAQRAVSTLNNCCFDSCSASNNGGAFYTANTTQNTLNDCTITNCSANYGGGLYSTSTSQNTLTNCTITDCSATNGGGVCSANTSQNTLTDCNISNCSATNGGGGLYSSSTSQNTLTDCTISGCSATNGGGLYSTNTSQNTLTDCTISGNTLDLDTTRRDAVIVETSVAIINGSNFGALRIVQTAQVTVQSGITTVETLTLLNSSGVYPTITLNDGAALTLTGTAVIGSAKFTSDGRGYLAVGAGIDTSAATLTNVVLCAYGAGLESFAISADGANWTAQDLTTPILIETRDAGGDWQTLTDNATGGEYATTFALESTARAFDGVAFFVATLPGYWQADAGAVDANDWSVKGFAAANSNGGGDAQGDAAQGWTVTPSTVTPNADGV